MALFHHVQAPGLDARLRTVAGQESNPALILNHALFKKLNNVGN